MPAPRETANESYTRQREEINGLLTQIKDALKEKDQEQARDPKNWGFAGDATFVAQNLNMLANILQS